MEYPRMGFEEYNRAMAKAMPHGPEDPCSCTGTNIHGQPCVCEGHVIGCTCDIDWEEVRLLKERYYGR